MSNILLYVIKKLLSITQTVSVTVTQDLYFYMQYNYMTFGLKMLNYQ